jgi:hypothetical protein
VKSCLERRPRGGRGVSGGQSVESRQNLIRAAQCQKCRGQESSVKCQVRPKTTRQTAISRLEIPSRCHSCPNPQFVSVLGYGCLGSTENIGRHGPSRVFLCAPFFLSTCRETCPATRSSSSPVLTSSSKSSEEHVTISKAPVQFSCVLSQALTAISHPSRS